MLGASYCLAVSAGLRSGEVRGVHRDQIVRRELSPSNWLYGLIVDRAVNEQRTIGGLKKGSEEDRRYRVVILPERTIKILDLWLHYAPAGGPIFTYRGRPMTKDHYLDRFILGLSRAKIDVSDRRITVHALRYTYNTRMRPLLSAQALQEFVGHRSDEMTEHYDRPLLEARLLQLSEYTEAVNRFW